MTFPGVQGITGKGVLGLTPIGQQIRQSRAGQSLGNPYFQTVLDTMGANAPAWGIAAEQAGGIEEYQDQPHSITLENFEEGTKLGGIDQFGVDQTNPSYFNPQADPALHDKPNYTGM